MDPLSSSYERGRDPASHAPPATPIVAEVRLTRLLRSVTLPPAALSPGRRAGPVALHPAYRPGGAYTMDLRRVCRRLPLVAVGLTALAGCDLTDTDPPTEAFYRLQSDKPVQVITSTEFIASGTEVVLYRADTVTVSTKEATVALAAQPRFFIRALALSPTTNVQLKVDVGDRNWYDAGRVISPPDKLEFVYGYTGTM